MTTNTTKKKIVGNPTKTQLGLKGFFAVLTFFLAAFARLPGEPLENGTVAVERHDCFREISPTDIKADGCLREFLVRQQEGLTGHYWVQGYPFNIDFWAGETQPSNKSWWPYEQSAYLLDGTVRLGLLLGDKSMLQKYQGDLDWVINHPVKDGQLDRASELTVQNGPWRFSLKA